MPDWQRDSYFLLQTRLAVGRGGAQVWGLALIGLFFYLTVGPRGSTAFVVALAGGFLLVVAFPATALQLLAWDRDGRLDERRLCGTPPGRLLAVLMFGSCWPVLAVGTALCLAGAWRVAALPLVLPVVLLTGSAAGSLLLLAAPGVGRNVDIRILQLFVLLVSAVGILPITLLVLGVDFPGVSTAPAPLLRLRQYGLPALALCAAVGLLALPRAVALMRRPPITGAVSVRTMGRRFVDLRTHPVPEFARATIHVLSAPGALADIVLCPVLTALLLQLPQGAGELPAVLIMFLPLFIGGYVASSAVRLEASRGTLDLIRLTGRPAWKVLTQAGLGLILPFWISSLASIAVAILIDPLLSRALLFWPSFALLLVFAGFAEGLSGRRPAVYLVPAVVVSVLLAIVVMKIGWWAGLVLVWIPAAVAIGRYTRPDGPALRGVAAAAAVACACVILATALDQNWMASPERTVHFIYFGGLHQAILLVPGGLAILAGWLVPERAPAVNVRALALHAVVAAAAMGAVASTVGEPRSHAAAIGLLAASGLVYGWLAHNLFGRTPALSFVARAAPQAAILIGQPLRWQVSHNEHFTYLVLGGFAVFALVDVLLAAALVVRARKNRS